MDSKGNKSKENTFEEQIEEMKEWQENQFNPGYYIGSGRTPLAIKNLGKHPFVIIILGFVFLLPTLLNLVKNFNVSSLLSNLIPLAIGCIFIIGGFIRLFRNKN